VQCVRPLFYWIPSILNPIQNLFSSSFGPIKCRAPHICFPNTALMETSGKYSSDVWASGMLEAGGF